MRLDAIKKIIFSGEGNFTGAFSNNLTKKEFYILSFTWGLIMTVIGGLVAIIMLITGHKPVRNKYGLAFLVGEHWGGVSFGPICVTQKNPGDDLLSHEFGHAIQNCRFGLAFPFIVAIPSAVRYWYREYLVRVKHKKYSELPDYDSIWFEGQATALGNRY